MHIILFGGSFDPPHLGHSQIAHNIIDKKITDQIWFIPCYSHPFSKKLSAPQYRLNMVNLITNHAILVNDYEIAKKGTSYSFDTLKFFQNLHPNDTFSWLIGSDQLPSFDKWKHYQEFLNASKIYVYPREGYPFEPMYKNMIALHEFPLVTISSTQVRDAIKNGQPIDGLVPQKVEEYIHINELY